MTFDTSINPAEILNVRFGHAWLAYLLQPIILIKNPTAYRAGMPILTRKLDRKIWRDLTDTGPSVSASAACSFTSVAPFLYFF